MHFRRRAILLPVLFVLIAGALACASSSSSSENDTQASTTTPVSSANLLTSHPAFGTCPTSAFPDLSAYDREFFMTGITEQEWERLLKEVEDA
jgi:hypothetical protein